jgi:hypothetical protein
MELGRTGKNISRSGSYKAIQVRLLDNIIVIEDITLKANMGKLLDNMRTPATQTRHADGASGQLFLSIGSQKRLARIAVRVHFVRPRSNTPTGAPMTLTQSAWIGTLLPFSHTQPEP